jgi:hypothetical protein
MAGGAADDLIQQGAVGDRVVGHRRAGVPQRCRGGERLGDGFATMQVKTVQAAVQRRVGETSGV